VLAATGRSGGRILSLRNRRTRREWVWRSRRSDRSAAGRYRPDGIDECLPGIGACAIEVGPARRVEIPDHGDAWHRTWSLEAAAEDHLLMSCTLMRGALELTRSIRAVGEGAFEFSYRLINRDGQPMPHGWAWHPALRVAEPMRLEARAAQAWVEYGAGPAVHRAPQLGPHAPPPDRVGWPWLRQGTVQHDLACLDPTRPARDKLVFRTEELGPVALVARDGTRLTMHPDPATTPYLAVCRWMTGRRRSSWVALEPSMTPVDRFDAAVQAGTAQWVAGHGEARWGFRLTEDGPGSAVRR
jgi:galactose mutarotase-like enzyme